MSDMTEGAAIASERIAHEARERTGSLDLGRLGLTVLPEELFALKHLRRLNLGRTIFVGDWRSWVESPNDAPNDIESSLDRLIELPELEILSVSGCKLARLDGVAGLKSLRILNCSYTKVSDLTPLSRLSALQWLWCSDIPVTTLDPLAGLTEFQSLNCSDTKVSDLAPLSGLSRLQALECFGTEVRDLAPLAGLSALQSLGCSRTKVSDLQPLAGLPALRRLDCSECFLTDFPQGLLFRPSLKELILYGCHLADVPAAVLSQIWGENCLEALRAHVRDLKDGTTPVSDVKLMVLGNGRVGKTQLCRRLRGKAYDEGVASTHGIVVSGAPLPAADDARLQIWDFGGQDIYHGTHALFMRTSAIFLLAWTPAFEDAREYEHDGMVFRNHPLAYWVDYVRHLGGGGSPVLIVQTQCDRPEDEAVCPVPEADLFQAFQFRPILRTSARTDRGRAALDQALAEAAAWLREREGIAVIGLGRYRVQRRLEAMRDADAILPRDAKQHRTITKVQFLGLCEEAGGISSPDHLLAYLHNSGIVFHRSGLFHDAIILDQAWALEAIYAVFHRGKSYTKIRRQHGRFTRSDLEDWVWGKHSVAEQKLFLSMMQSCGICFEHRRLGFSDAEEIEYIAPDLLPAWAEVQVELEQKWDEDLPIEADWFEYPLLHPGLMRNVISRIGAQAGLAAEYWQGGVYVYESETKSRGLIEQEMIDDWRGWIRVQTQRGQAAELLQRLMGLVEAEQNRAGMTPIKVTTTARAEAMVSGAIHTAEPGAGPAEIMFAQEPSSAPEWCVSYAWGDDTPEGRKQEAIVDRLCAEAEEQGKRILRDKKDMGLGERISKFMQRIGVADRVFVVLSDKYLKSPFCMFELSEVWRTSRQEDEEFLKRIRVYTLPDAAIWTPINRTQYAIHWRREHDALEALVKEHGCDILGEKDSQQLRRMRDFSRNVGDILAAVADTLQPRSFEKLVEYGFSD